MSDLEFTNFSLSIEDLPARARGLDEDATSDVLGGYSRAAAYARRRKMIIAMRRRRAASMQKRRAAYARKRKMSGRKSSPARRSRKKQFAAKASFHSRMASRYRRMARA